MPRETAAVAIVALEALVVIVGLFLGRTAARRPRSRARKP